jgi:endogenous inhibitor of DNA gyrase (YacG/DUF329 family)
MNVINESDLDIEGILATQIPEYVEQPTQEVREEQPAPQVEAQPENSAKSFIGTKLGHKIGSMNHIDKEETKKMVEDKKLSRIGESIQQNVEFREGWIDVDRALLGGRSVFYPEDWQFRIRPATVEAIRNWSAIDDENALSIDDVFNEILKSCLSIVTPMGPLPWSNIRSWDRFFFILLIREYTFVQGESKIEFTEDCPNCDNPVPFTLRSTSLDYDLPDPEVMGMFDKQEQNWLIVPEDYDVPEDPITLYLPTLEKDANIKAWMIQRYQEKKKIDTIFIKFLPWLAPKISKDTTIANRQIREYEMKFKSWDTEMFSLMDDVIRNIVVTPATNMITTCPTCGEEVTTQIRFQDGVRSLFSMANKHKKFGKK